MSERAFAASVELRKARGRVAEFYQIELQKGKQAEGTGLVAAEIAVLSACVLVASERIVEALDIILADGPRERGD